MESKNVETKTSMNKADREEFIRRVKGMSAEEQELALEYIPVELCLARISKELDRARTLEERIKYAMAGSFPA